MAQQGTPASADALDLLIADHREVDEMIERLKATSATDVEQRSTLACEIITDLVRHSIGEEEVIYPRMRQAVPDGDRRVDDDIAEHQEVEQLLAEVEHTDAGDPHFMQLWQEIAEKLEHHIDDEENEDFPALRQHVDADELVDLASLLKLSKEVAPTHPHPHGPSTPPMNIVANRGAALFDKVRDAVRNRT